MRGAKIPWCENVGGTVTARKHFRCPNCGKRLLPRMLWIKIGDLPGEYRKVVSAHKWPAAKIKQKRA